MVTFEAALARAHVARARGDTQNALAAFEAVTRRWPRQAEGWIEASEDALRLGTTGATMRLLWSFDLQRGSSSPRPSPARR